MYGRLSSSFALLTSDVVMGIRTACGICILFIQNLKLTGNSFQLLDSSPIQSNGKELSVTLKYTLKQLTMMMLSLPSPSQPSPSMSPPQPRESEFNLMD